jgi:hypothetical protein
VTTARMTTPKNAAATWNAGWNTIATTVSTTDNAAATTHTRKRNGGSRRTQTG